MQNHLQYPQSFAGQGPTSPVQHQKFNSPTHLKGFDKTLPSPTIKHYASNPNLSLDFNPPKMSATTSDTNNSSANSIKKNLEYRSPPSHSQYTFNQNQHSRGMRNEMTKSLIIGDTNNIDTPEEAPSKKETFKNMPKRQYRMSETIEDTPIPPSFMSKR